VRDHAYRTDHRQSLPVAGCGLSLSAVKLALRVGHRSSGTNDLADSDEEGLRERSVMALREGTCAGLEGLDARRRFARHG